MINYCIVSGKKHLLNGCIMEENKELLIPEAMSDALYDDKITPKQRKFILLLVHSEGLKTATQCAIEAGYAKRSAFMIASRLLFFLLNYLVSADFLDLTNFPLFFIYLHGLYF